MIETDWHDLLLTADEVIARLQDPRLVAAVAIHSTTAMGIWAHVAVQFHREQLRPAPVGALLALAARVGLENLKVGAGVEGTLAGHTVRLWA